MKRIILSEGQMKAVVREMLGGRSLLNEISAQDAYNKFYSNKVPKEKFDVLMKGAPTMTPLHKKALDLMTGPKKDFDAGEWNDRLANIVAEVWNSGNENMKKYAIDQLMDFTSSNVMAYYLEKLFKFKHHTEAEYADNGYLVLGENSDYLITCTTSYAASKKHFGDSHWCTASDVGGTYNGFRMFTQYTGIDGDDEPSLLIQLVSKERREDSIQIQLYDDGGTGDICAFNGNRVDRIGLESHLYDVRQAVNNAGGFEKLWKQTEENVGEEEEYWNKRYYEVIDKRKKKIMADESTYDEDILTYMDSHPYNACYYRYNGQDGPRFKYKNITYLNGDYWKNASVSVYNVELFGLTKDDFEWIVNAQDEGNYDVANGFNNQVWVVDKKQHKIISKVRGGYIDRAINNVGLFVQGDIELEDSYGDDSLVDLQTGRIIVKKLKVVKTMWMRDIPYEVDGHHVLLFFEDAKESPSDNDKSFGGTMKNVYTSGIDTVTGKYLGHIKIDWMKKDDVYGNAAIINI